MASFGEFGTSSYVSEESHARMVVLFQELESGTGHASSMTKSKRLSLIQTSAILGVFPSTPCTVNKDVTARGVLADVIEKGEYACHRCDNPACSNPWHLFVGSSQENRIDGSLKRVTGSPSRMDQLLAVGVEFYGWLILAHDKRDTRRVRHLACGTEQSVRVLHWAYNPLGYKCAHCVPKSNRGRPKRGDTRIRRRRKKVILTERCLTRITECDWKELDSLRVWCVCSACGSRRVCNKEARGFFPCMTCETARLETSVLKSSLR